MDVYQDLKSSKFKKVSLLPTFEVTEADKKQAKKENFNHMIYKLREKLSLQEKMTVIEKLRKYKKQEN